MEALNTHISRRGVVETIWNSGVTNTGNKNKALNTLNALAQRVCEQTVVFNNWRACLVDINLIILDALHTSTSVHLICLAICDNCVANTISIYSITFITLHTESCTLGLCTSIG